LTRSRPRSGAAAGGLRRAAGWLTAPL